MRSHSLGPERSLRYDHEMMRGYNIHESRDLNGGRRGNRNNGNRDSSSGLVMRNSFNDIPVIIQDGNGDSDGVGRYPGRWRVHHLRDGEDLGVNIGLRALGQLRDLGPFDVRNYVLSEKVNKLKSESRANFIFL